MLQAGLPLAVMDADHKTVKRLLDSMIFRGMLCAPLTVEVAAAKSPHALCQPRPIVVYCGPAAKVLHTYALCVHQRRRAGLIPSW